MSPAFWAFTVGSMRIVLGAIIALLLLTPMSRADDMAVTYIEVFDTNSSLSEPAALGSGFLIDDLGHILTARHVLDDVGVPRDQLRLMIRFGSKEAQALRAQVVDCSEGYIDICLLRANGLDTYSSRPKPFRPLCRPLGAEPVTVKGFPPGDFNPMITRDGKISSANIGAELKYTADVDLDSGMSGGPVLDENQYVIGLNTGVSGNVTFLQPLSYGVDLVLKTGINCLDIQARGTEERADVATLRCKPIRTSIESKMLADYLLGNTISFEYPLLSPTEGCRIVSVTTTRAGVGFVTNVAIEYPGDGSAMLIFDFEGLQEYLRNAAIELHPTLYAQAIAPLLVIATQEAAQ